MAGKLIANNQWDVKSWL